MNTNQLLKDPNAILDYSVNWSDWLDTDTISNSSWTVPTDLTIQLDSHTDTVATVWLSGGVVGEKYTVTNRIVTVGGRTEDRSLYILVEQR